jgi:hypothetical protein
MLGAMYYPQRPREPSGCMQSVIITRMILGILLVPMAIIIGAILALLVALWALDKSPLLALGFLVLCGFGLMVAIKWESRRVGRDVPPDE